MDFVFVSNYSFWVQNFYLFLISIYQKTTNAYISKHSKYVFKFLINFWFKVSKHSEKKMF